MEYISLLAVNIGSKDITIGSVWLGKYIILEANQSITSIDIQGHGDWESPFRSRKSGNKMSAYFGRNADDKIGMNPLRAISRVSQCHGKIKSESKKLMETLRDNKVFKNDEREHNFEVENVWRVDDVN